MPAAVICKMIGQELVYPCDDDVTWGYSVALVTMIDGILKPNRWSTFELNSSRSFENRRMVKVVENDRTVSHSHMYLCSSSHL